MFSSGVMSFARLALPVSIRKVNCAHLQHVISRLAKRGPSKSVLASRLSAWS